MSVGAQWDALGQHWQEATFPAGCQALCRRRSETSETEGVCSPITRLPPQAASRRRKARRKGLPLIVLSYFIGAADKAGTRENQVGWELPPSRGGGKGHGLWPPLSVIPVKFARLYFVRIPWRF